MMPFKSQQQRKFMYAVHPDIAREWEKETPKGKKLPKKKECNMMPTDKDEAVDLKQLRDPVGFVNGVDQFIQDTRQQAATLQHFADTYAQSVSANPEQKKVAAGIKISLPNVTRALDMLEKGLGQLKTKDMAAGKKDASQSRLPGVQGQPPAKKSGILSKLFGGGK